jgi:hypothetical protein
MRRLLTVTALGLLSGILGCHTAGVCDCDLCNNPCNYGPTHAGSCCNGGGSPGLIHGTGPAYSTGSVTSVDYVRPAPVEKIPVDK